MISSCAKFASHQLTNSTSFSFFTAAANETKNGRNGAALRDLRGHGQRPQDHGEPEGQEAPAGEQERPRHESQQVRARFDPRGRRLRPLRTSRVGAPQDLEGQTLLEVPQEADRESRARQEEARGDVQHAPGHEEAQQINVFRFVLEKI